MAIKSVFFQRDALRWLIWSCVILALVGFFLSTVNRNQEKNHPYSSGSDRQSYATAH